MVATDYEKATRQMLFSFKEDVKDLFGEVKADLKAMDKKVTNELSHRLPGWATLALVGSSSLITGLVVKLLG